MIGPWVIGFRRLLQDFVDKSPSVMAEAAEPLGADHEAAMRPCIGEVDDSLQSIVTHEGFDAPARR